MSDGSTSTAAALVPEIFYDLISRVVPGTILLPTIALAWLGPTRFHSLSQFFWIQPSDDQPSGLLLLTLYLFAAYAAGVLFRGLYYLVIVDFTPRLLNRTPGEHYLDYKEYYDIKLELPDAGSRLAKLKAEVSMAGVLEAGLCLAFALNVINAVNSECESRLTVGLCLLTGIACTDAYRRHIRLRVAQAVKIHTSILSTRPTPAAPDSKK